MARLRAVPKGSQAKDWSGAKIGQLEVISFSHIGNNKQKRHYYWVKCSCGITKITQLDGLLDGRTQRCGPSCPDRPRRTPEGQCVTTVMATYRVHARNKNKEFALTRDQFSSLLFAPCNYCGTDPCNQYLASSPGHTGTRAKDILVFYNGVDRVDSTLGYTLDNVVTCCALCNQAKNDLSLKDWLNHCKKIIEHLEL